MTQVLFKIALVLSLDSAYVAELEKKAKQQHTTVEQIISRQLYKQLQKKSGEPLNFDEAQ